VRAAVLRDDVHAHLDEVRAEVDDLLLRYLDLLEAAGYLIEGEKPALPALGGEVAQLLDLHEGRLGGFLQKSNCGLVLLRQPMLLQQRRDPYKWAVRLRRSLGGAVRTAGLAVGGKVQGMQPTQAIVQRLVRFAADFL
jgi:hypothetical protein